MKKPNISLIFLTALFCYLFYKQRLGLNVIVFTVSLIAFYLWQQPKRFSITNWLVVAIGSLISAISVFLITSELSYISFILSIVILSSQGYQKSSSLFANLLHGCYSLLFSFYFFGKKLIEKFSMSTPNPASWWKFLPYIFSTLFAIIFFLVYRSANPLFENYSNRLYPNFLDLNFILFSIFSLLVIYGITRNQKIMLIEDWENNLSKKNFFKKATSELFHQNRAFVWLFLILNSMILLINLLDVKYLYLDFKLPDGLTHKKFVHNGVGSLIFSILFGLGLILYQFRFKKKDELVSRYLRILVYVWLTQNVFMLISTAIRNHIYIMDALLTYKRIGVYYWLLLCFIGMYATFIKIQFSKSTSLLVKQCSIIIYFILVLSCTIDWDKQIGSFNLNYSPNLASLDKRYLIYLSESNLPLLCLIKNDIGFDNDSSYHYKSYLKTKNSLELDKKLSAFLVNVIRDSWQSHSIRTNKILESLISLNAKSKIKSLDASSLEITDLKPLTLMSNVSKLKLGYTLMSPNEWLSSIKQFKQLDTLYLTSISLQKIDAISQLKSIKVIGLESTPKMVRQMIQNNLPHVKVLNLDKN